MAVPSARQRQLPNYPSLVAAAPAMGRVIRRPQHPFYLHQRPFEITPFFIAPVLPGETMKNMLLQSRAVTDPLANPLIGWWLEYYFFYVKHRDLDDREDFTQMHLEPAFDMSGAGHLQTSAADSWRYTALGSVKWVDYCLTRVVDEYFRDEGEVAGDHVISTGKPAAKIMWNSWMDNLIPASQLAAADVSLGEVGESVTSTGAFADDELMVSEIDAAMRQYEFLRANGLVQMDYEDYLATFGIKVPGEEQHRPELVRYVRDWTYPTNTIDPTNGTPRSACSWAIAERADKARFFKEPGFLFGVTLARPKVYFAGQSGNKAGELQNAFSWLPAMMQDDPMTSLRNWTAASGVLPSTSADYVADLRDLLIYGDQFVNVPFGSVSDINEVALPANDLSNVRYPSATDVDALFVTVEGGTAGLTKYRVRQDGIVTVNVAGRQVDATPRGGQISTLALT